jgi:predicted lysophospholipase L1 biosynthesis ABC-type transport system permease subunit
VRALDVNEVPTPTFGVEQMSGDMHFVVLAGRAPTAPDEIAFAPTTMEAVGVSIGDRVTVGEDPDRHATVVGKVLLPETSHTAYDQSAWMTRGAVDDILAAEPPAGPEDLWDSLLVRWAPGSEEAGDKRLAALAGDSYFFERATLPPAVSELHTLRALPLVLAAFFGLLAVATVAHALVTTVRRRRHDLAIMRSFGLTARQSRVAIAWQATLLAVAGVIVGVPLGLIAGRTIWRWLANDYPVVYVPPIELVAILLVVPAALLVVNAIAVGPARAAARIRPAEALRVE